MLDAPTVAQPARTSSEEPGRRRRATDDGPGGRRRSTEPTGRRRAAEETPGAERRVDDEPGRRRAAEAGPATGRRRAADPDDAPTGRSERSGGGRVDGRDDDARRIDLTLTRMTAAHAGITLLDDDRPVAAPRAPARRRPVALLVGVLALLVFSVTAFQYVAKARLDDAVRAVAALDPGSGAIVDAEGQAGDENVLIVGSSAGTAGPRGDTVLLAHVPAGGGEVVGLAIPRDLEVNRPPCRKWDPATGGYLDEIVPAEARSPLLTALDEGGPQCATRVVQQLTGLAVTRYVGVDLDGVGALVDVVGGVDVCMDRPVLDDVLGTVVPAAGVSTLDGRRTRDLLQARSVQGDAGDRDTLERQQRVLAAAVGRVLSADVLLDPGRIGAIGDALGGALTLDGADLDRVLATGLALRSFAADGVTFATVPTAPGASSQGGALLQEADAAELFEALREGATLPEQTVLAASGAPTPEEVSVEILNAAGRAGLAGEVGDTLGSLGFAVTGVTSAPATVDATEIRFSPDRAAAAQVLGQSVPSAVTVPDPAASGLLQLVLGSGFDGVVRAPTTSSTGAPETPVVRCP